MKQCEMLHVIWSDREECTYYIDKDKYSKATRNADGDIVLKTYCGIYTFKTNTKNINNVEFYDGTCTILRKVKSWNTYFTPCITKEEKSLINAYVKLQKVKFSEQLSEKDAYWIENEVTGIIGNRNIDYRYAVVDYVSKLINELNK